MSRLYLNWVRAAILAANDGIILVTALSVGVASIRPSAVLVARFYGERNRK
jgi:VIT1/CCC1 family predicted Fe2+/Mn2+ transporter